MFERGQLTLAAAAIRCQGVAIDGTGTVEASRCIVTAVGANMTSGGKSALIYIYRCHGAKQVKPHGMLSKNILLNFLQLIPF